MSTNMNHGLEGVVAATTRLSSVDGEAGVLLLAGFPVEEIAPRATFEEMVHLLWTGELPDATELKDFERRLAARRELPAAVLDLLRSAARRARTRDGRPADGRGRSEPCGWGGEGPEGGRRHAGRRLPVDRGRPTGACSRGRSLWRPGRTSGTPPATSTC